MSKNKKQIGKLQYKLTNDYLFHIVFQRNKKILRGLVQSLLNLKDEEIIDIVLENPITPGETVNDKTIVLDLFITLNNNIYSDKFLLNVLDLNHPELATEEDIACGLQYWARLFKAETWEDLHMLASEYEVFEDITDTVEQALADKKIRMECEARERYERDRISLFASGQKTGENLMAQLVNLLLNDNRIDDIKRITQDSTYRNQLYEEYGLLKQ